MIVEHAEGVSPHAYIYSNVVIGKNVTIFPGAVVGRPPMSSGAARKIDISKLPPLVIGDGSVIGANAVIYIGSTLGEKVMICDCACVRENVTIGNNTLVAMGVTINCDTKIGNNVKIMDNTHITGNAVIEDGVFIGMLVTTANDNTMNRGGQQMHEMLGPVIRKNARIGQGACLFPGIEVGEDAVIGANAVVTKSVPAGKKAVGIPAKIIE